MCFIRAGYKLFFLRHSVTNTSLLKTKACSKLSDGSRAKAKAAMFLYTMQAHAALALS